MSTDPEPLPLWREFRSWPRTLQLGLAALALAVFGATFVIEPLYGSDFPDESAWPEGELPDGVPIDAAAPAPEAALPAGVELYDGDPLWTEAAEDGEQVAHLDAGTLRLTDSRLALEVDGRPVWSHEWEEYGAEVGVAGGVVVVSLAMDDLDDETYEWPGRQDTVALDLATGEEVWRDRDASFVTVFSDAVVMTECTGDQDDRIGDCTMYARDPANLDPLWSTPTYASARVLDSSPWTGEPAPERLLVESFPTGHDSRTVTAYRQGESLGSVATQAGAVLSGDTLVVYDDWDDNPADGCTATLAGHRLGESDPAWTVEAMTRKTEDLTSCGGLPAVTPVGGRLPLTIDGRPAVVDTETGATVWQSEQEGQAVAIHEESLAVVDWESEEDNLTLYDTATGAVLWSASAAFGSGDRATAVGSTLWLYGDASMWGWTSYDLYAYDLATGTATALPGTAAYFAPGELVTTTGDHDAPTLNAWPSDLW
ncbi:hypothetical protein GCM10009830_17340 [Glycomyces endophyticus]|uniref:Pyrrolo-quinoline quinone repeat domain-containing protein n=1 Tax=Glycomyces endophyticus TaxID=480996 RepID=A0ABN2GIE6_9ACTN